MKKLFYNALIVNEGRCEKGWLAVDGELIADMGFGNPSEEVMATYAEKEDVGEAYLIPGAIDTHVHFREPGMTQKADMASESAAAVAGGVTSFFDMPNTSPATLTLAALEDKKRIAQNSSIANYAFFLGASNSNLEELEKAEFSRIPGIKAFLGSSTGNMLVDREQALDKIFGMGQIVAVHAEDEAIIRRNASEAREKFGEGNVPMYMHSQIRSREACVEATRKAIERAKKYGTRLHVCHLSTADEVQMISDCNSPKITGEACLLHLLFCDDDFNTLGWRIKANPSVKSKEDREIIRQAVKDRKILTVATDHAPHLEADKQGDALTAASGAPMVQFSLSAMMDLAEEGCWEMPIVAETMAHAPATLFGIDRRGYLRKGYFADFVIVRREPRVVGKVEIVSKCGWSPLEGRELRHKVIATYVNGHPAYEHGAIDRTVKGKELVFNH